MTAVKTVVVYHSGYGHTALVAQSVAKGAGPGARLVAIGADGAIDEDDWVALNTADAIIFGAPTYMGSASAPFKIFADATSKVFGTRGWQDKVAGGFTNSHSFSGDKLSTLQQMAVLAAQQGMIWVSLGEMPAEDSDIPFHRDPTALNRLGSFLGLMTAADHGEPEKSLPEGDLKTAENYGARVAGVAARLRG